MLVKGATDVDYQMDFFIIKVNLSRFEVLNHDISLTALYKFQIQEVLPQVVIDFTSYDSGLILGFHPANGRHRCKVMPSLIGWAQT